MKAMCCLNLAVTLLSSTGCPTRVMIVPKPIVVDKTPSAANMKDFPGCKLYWDWCICDNKEGTRCKGE